VSTESITSYRCTQCGRRFMFQALLEPHLSCMNLHLAGECCHAGEVEVTGEVELNRNVARGTLVWNTIHARIDGVATDRDSADPGVELAMEPIGYGLSRDKQSRRLRIALGHSGSFTGAAVLDEDGIAFLRAFLDRVP
jgi:acid stress-induced BolA-like protein IbaG/YrbA